MTYTPGPWEVEVDKSGEVTVYEAVTRENIDICTMSGNMSDRSNGRLIAAAPDLLEALKEIAAGATYRLSKGPDEGDSNTLRLALAAIAKAEAV
jgi:hypothetical protein